MKKHWLVYFLYGLGWVMLLLGLVMAQVRSVGLDPQLYFDLQKEAGVHETAGISQSDLLHLDVNLANYLAGKYDDPNLQIEVYGQLQPAFNETELQHLADCRKLFTPTMNVWLNIGLAVGGVALLVPLGERKVSRNGAVIMWIASAVLVLPVAFLGFWAAVDFNSAFVFFHKMLFANDLWQLNPATDLLIRICPASMFANLGLRIGLRSAAILLGFPLLGTVLYKLDKRKRKQHETDDL